MGPPSSATDAAPGPVTLDPAVLGRLAVDLEDAAEARSFARRYRRMLAARVDRIRRALLRTDLKASLDAALSLKVSSLAVGAHELAALAERIEQSVRREELDLASDLLSLLSAAAVRTAHAIEALVGHEEEAQAGRSSMR